jgi:4-hydroxy-4-methyl-2-oxoglutarate aldolase
VNQSDLNAKQSTVAHWKQSAARLNTALVLDVLDSLDLRHQALHPGIVPRTTQAVSIGSAKTLLWMNFAHDDSSTYELELKAIDSLLADEFVVCATADSDRSGIWGELLTAAAIKRGAAGVVTDGGVRDVSQIQAMNFPVFSRYLSPYDSFNRQKVVAFDVRVEIDGVTIEPGDIIVADQDGVAVVPSRLAAQVLEQALAKAGKEDQFRDAVMNGSSLLEAYERYQVL